MSTKVKLVLNIPENLLAEEILQLIPRVTASISCQPTLFSLSRRSLKCASSMRCHLGMNPSLLLRRNNSGARRHSSKACQNRFSIHFDASTYSSVGNWRSVHIHGQLNGYTLKEEISL